MLGGENVDILKVYGDIIRIPERRFRVEGVEERVKRLVDESREYDEGDRFELGRDIMREYGFSEDLIEILRVDGVMLSGYLSEFKGIVRIRVKGRINNLGYRMKRGKIVVEGDVGNWLGYRMEGGEIVVLGNAGNWVGMEMRGGRIVVKGDVGSYLGYRMMGGEITVEGNARYGVGEGMFGGEITVKGNAGKGLGNDMRGGIIRVMGEVSSFGYRGGGRVFYLKDGRWVEKEVDYYLYYK